MSGKWIVLSILLMGLSILLLGLPLGCSAPPIVPVEEKYLDYQTVGKIEICQPEKKRDSVHIPLQLDETIWKFDADRVISRVHTSATNNTIFLHLMAVESTGRVGTSRPVIIQAGLDEGTYKLVYVDSDSKTMHPIGRVYIPRLPSLPGPPR